MWYASLPPDPNLRNQNLLAQYVYYKFRTLVNTNTDVPLQIVYHFDLVMVKCAIKRHKLT